MAIFTPTELKELIRDCRWDQAAEILLYLEGKPFSLEKYGLWRLPYQTHTPEKLYMEGRQIAKSVTLANETTVNCALRPFFKVLYVSPSQKQTHFFSWDKLTPALKFSPIISKELFDKTTISNVGRKNFKNGSVIELSYIGDSADRIRGFTADMVCVDEIQDIKFLELPIVYETMSASKFQWKRFAGTPKDQSNTIELLWQRSSKHEWVIICSKCELCNVPDAEHIRLMIGEDGPSCVNCGALLNVRNGGWCPMNEDWNGLLTGFHFPQIVIPNNVEGINESTKRPKWFEILDKREKREYTPMKFSNEVLGISHDEGARLVTLTELKECCSLGPAKLVHTRMGGYTHICGGVDWGVSGETSRTALCIAGILPDGKTTDVLFGKIFEGVDVYQQVIDIAGLLRKYGCTFVGCDFGVGNANNMHLRREFSPERVLEMWYTNLQKFMRWDSTAMGGLGRYVIDRTGTLNLMFFEMKKKEIRFPDYRDFEPFLQDILAMYEEELSSGRKRFSHPEGVPDDFAHALNFCCLALKRASGNPILELQVSDGL